MKIRIGIIVLFFMAFLIHCKTVRRSSREGLGKTPAPTSFQVSQLPDFLKSAHLEGKVEGEGQSQLKLDLIIGTETLSMGTVPTVNKGKFAFPSIPPGVYRLTCRKLGFASTPRYLWIDDGANWLSVPLAQAAVVSGQVIDQFRHPVKNATVTAHGELQVESSLDKTTTDQAGRFWIRWLSAGSYEIHAQAPGYRGAGQPNVMAPQQDIVLRLARLYTLKGKLKAPDSGSVIPGDGSVAIKIGGSGVWPYRTTKADPLGGFTFTEVPAGVYEIIAHTTKSPWLASEVVSGIQVGPQDPLPIVLKLLPAFRVSGAVFYGEKPVHGATLILGREALTVLPNKTMSDPQGQFSFAPVAQGVLGVSVWKRGYLPILDMQIQTAESSYLKLYLKKGETLRGQIVDQQGYPIDAVQIRAVLVAAEEGNKGGVVPGELGITTGPVPPIPLDRQPLLEPYGFTAPSSATTDSTGWFALSGLLQGKIRVIAEHPDYSTTQSDWINLSTARNDSLKLIMRAGTRLEGQVLDSLGRGLSGAMVQLQTESSIRSLMTGPTGEFEFTGISGKVIISASRQGFMTVAKKLHLTSKPFWGVDLMLSEARGKIAGHVVNPEGLAVGGAMVVVSQGKHQVKGRSDKGGSFAMSGLGEGKISIRVQHDKYGEIQKDLPGGWRDEEIEIQFPLRSTVFGTVQDYRTATPINNFSIKYPGSSPERSLPVKHSKDGGFTIGGLGPGFHILIFAAPDYASQEIKIGVEQPRDLQATRGIEIQVVLKRAGQIQGEVSLPTGLVVAGAKVRCGKIITSTNEQGHFLLRNLPEGLQVLEIVWGGRTLRSEPIFVRPQETAGPVRIIFR